MFFTLLLLSTMTLTMYEISGNAIPVGRYSLQYFTFPDENMNDKNRQSRYSYPMNGYGYKRDYTKTIDDYTNTSDNGETHTISPSEIYTGHSDVPNKKLNTTIYKPSLIDLGLKKRSLESLALYEKLIALGVDYVEIMNLLTPLYENIKDLE